MLINHVSCVIGSFLINSIWFSSFRTTIRDKYAFWLRFWTHLIIPIVFGLQMGTEIGARGGCPPDFDAQFDPTELEGIQKSNKIETDAV